MLFSLAGHDGIPVQSECHTPAVPDAGLHPHLAAAHCPHEAVGRRQQAGHQAVHRIAADHIKVPQVVLCEQGRCRVESWLPEQRSEDVVVCDLDFCK